MSDRSYDYDTEELKSALDSVGVKPGSIVFSHIGMGFLGFPKNGKNLQAMFQCIYAAFSEVLGPRGTWLVPSYTYSFCRGEPFDIRNSPSTVGYFTEEFRKLPHVLRSREPNFSVAGFGPAVHDLFRDLPLDSFGKDCIYDRLIRARASICNIGVGFRYATFVHHAEQMAGVPYRFKKIFSGTIVDGERTAQADSIYYVRSELNDETTFPDLGRLEKDARKSGHLAVKTVGRGVVTNIACRALYDGCIRGIRMDPWFLARGRKESYAAI